MSEQVPRRRLAAILAADVVGYSRMMRADEAGTLAVLKSRRTEVLQPLVARYHGRIVKVMGDGVLVEFASAVEAVQCAVDLQQGMAAANDGLPKDRQVLLRIGINLGDVMAARLEALADPGSVIVSRTVFNHVRGKVKLGFDDLGEQQLKNIAEPARIYRLQPHGEAAATRVTLALPDKPSIAVLPFENMSGDPEQEYFADGVVEDIITALSRIKWLFVIARTSTFTYKGKAVDVKQIGGELGVRYVLEGSVRKADSRVRITGQLIDAASGAHLWADRFDGSLEDIFELQETIATSVAGVIEPALITAEIRRSVVRPTNDSTAYDLYLRALSLGYTWAKEAFLSALGLLEQAIERDPDFGPALALAVVLHSNLHSNGWGPNPDTNRDRSINFARRALGVAADDPFVLATSAHALAYFGEDIHAAIELVDRALALNPSFARGWVISGWLRLWAGQPEPAIRHLETSLRLSPRTRTAGTYMAIGVAHFFLRRFDDARAMLLRSLQEHADWPPTYRFLASCYAHMGLLDDARETVRKLQGLTTVLVPSVQHWRNPENRELFLQGLRLAVSEAV
jgi:adenylate cyclase